MNREAWELASWIATTVGLVVTMVGLPVVVIQLILQRKQTRLDALSALYAQLDTHTARLARAFIYNAPPERLRLAHLHSEGGKAEREIVEETLATLERMAYPITTRQLPSDDAFNLYGGALLSIAYRLWPYIEEQRELRRQSTLAHKLVYRRYLEAVVREWVPKYAVAAKVPIPSTDINTEELLRQVLGGTTRPSAVTRRRTLPATSAGKSPARKRK